MSPARRRKPIEAVEPQPNQTTLTVSEAAWLLRLHPTTVRQLISTGQLPASRIGRKILVTRAAVEGLIAGGGTGSA